jgi:hypothetical protein
MSGENQYISPIIDAFLRRRQQDLATQQNEAANQQKQASLENENKYREALITESKARLDEAHRKAIADEQIRQQQHENASLATKDAIQQKVAQAVRDAPEGQGDQAAINVMRSLGGQGILKGSNPLQVGGQELPGSPTTQLTMPGGGSFGTEGMPSNLQYAQQQATAAGLKSTAVQEPRTAAQLAVDAQKAHERETGKIQEMQQGLTNSLALEKARGTDAQTLEGIRQKGNQAIANTRVAGTIADAKIRMGEDNTLSPQQAGIQSEQAANDYWGIIDGTTDPKDIQKDKGRNLGVSHYAQSIGSEVPSKNIGAALNTYSQVGPIYQQAQDWAKEYSADSPKGGRFAAAQASNPATGKPTALGTYFGVGKDIQKGVDSINSQAARLAMQNDPNARLIGSVLAGQTKAIVDPSRTYQENMDNIDAVKKNNAVTFSNAVNGIPADVVTALKARKGILTWETP